MQHACQIDPSCWQQEHRHQSRFEVVQLGIVLEATTAIAAAGLLVVPVELLAELPVQHGQLELVAVVEDAAAPESGLQE